MMEMIMNRSTRYILFSVMTILSLLSACSPVPVATQDPALAQQAIDQSVALTVAAKDIQAKNQLLSEQSAALTSVAQNTSAPASVGNVTIPEGPAITTPTPEPTLNGTPDPNAPTIKSISPNIGFTVGGTTVTITGTNFVPGEGFTGFLFG